jgi:hypothetical protein
MRALSSLASCLELGNARNLVGIDRYFSTFTHFKFAAATLFVIKRGLGIYITVMDLCL